MTVNHKPAGTAKSIPVGLAYGWLAETICMLLCCVVLSVLVLGGKLKWEMSDYGIMVMLLLCSYIGASVSSDLVQHRKLMICLLSGGLYILTVIGIMTLFFGAQYSAVGTSSLLILGGSLVSALVHSAEKKKRGGGRRKRKL